MTPWIASLDSVQSFVAPLLLGIGAVFAARILWRVFLDA